METKEMTTIEEVMEPTMEIAKATSGQGLKIAAGIGLAVLAGGIAYKYVAKPFVAKIKAKKAGELFDIEIDGDVISSDDVSEVEE